MAGNIILWKSPRDNAGALLGGLYIVSGLDKETELGD